VRQRYVVVEGLRLSQSCSFDDFATAFRCALHLSSPEFPVLTILMPTNATAFLSQDLPKITRVTDVQAEEPDCLNTMYKSGIEPANK
jgi:hypothetical protein